MADCCDSRGCDQMFGLRFARRTAARYRARGPDEAARVLIDLLAQDDDLEGATVLEIGGGVGHVQLELLRRGAASATNLELSPAYDAEAAALIEQAGFTDRVQRRLVDLAEDPAGVEPADIVVLHRVVCCYPDYAKLLGAAADHTRRRLVFSYPPRNLVSRAFVAQQNLLFRLARREFRTFAHPPAAMLGVLAAHGLHLAATRRRTVWKFAVVTR